MKSKITKSKITKSEIMKKRIANILAFLVLLILGYILWLEHDELTLDREYEFTSVNSAFFGKDGKYYVVDRGREAICVLNSDMVMVRMLQGGEYERFYYAEAVAEDQDGIIYIADEAYAMLYFTTLGQMLSMLKKDAMCR